MQITDLVFIDSTGYHFADYPSFLSWIQDQYKGIYGADVVLTSDSQDGQFLAILAQAFFDTAALGASVYNSFSPATAQGVGLSRNVKINGLKRQIPTNSTVDVTIVGTAGTVITNGVVQDTLQQKWDLPPTVTIPGGGSIIVTATAEAEGAINAAPSTVTTIFTPTLGWQTVNNVSAATAGAPVEQDGALRARQAVSTADPSLTVFDGTVGGVANLTGVTAVKGYENPTGSADGNGIPAHSISLVVKGGDAQAIANEIGLHKTPGTGTYGTTSETVYDAHGMPLTIAFYRPTDVTITVEVTVASKPGWTTDYETQIAAAVAAQALAAGIGATVVLTKFYAAAQLLGTPAGLTYDVSLIRLKKNAGSFGSSNITLAFNEDPVCDPTVNVVFIVT